MAQGCQKTLFCYCHVGGELIINADKSVSYKGGTVDGVVINQDTTFETFLVAVCERLNVTQSGRTFQYSLKFDKSCLLPLKDQTAFDNLLNFNDDVGHVYISEDRSTAQVVVGSVRCSISENESAADQCLALEAEHINAIQCCESEHVNATPCIEPEHVKETQCLEAEHADETPTLTDENRPGKRPALSCNEWEEEIIGVGQQFQSAHALRLALSKYAVAKRFTYKFKRNEQSYLSVGCAAHGCPWNLLATGNRNTSSVTVRKFVDSHNHSKQDEIDLKLNTKLIVEYIAEKITSTPSCRPREICKDIESAYDVTLSYKQSWRCMERAKFAAYGKLGDSYKLIPHFCQCLIDVMPGTVAMWTSTDSRFKQLFVAYSCSIRGFLHGCRPLLFVDDFKLSVPARGVLLSVTAMDGNDNAFPLAYGVINSDDDPDCLWFFERLKSIIGDLEISIISDKKSSILNGLNQVFGWENNSYCFRRVKENFKSFIHKFHLGTDGKNSALTLLNDIAYARSDSTYDKALNIMRKFNKDMYDWVLANNPELWANSHVRTKRWDKLSSDVTDPFNSWVLKNCQVAVLEFMKGHRTTVAELLVSRQRDVATWKGPVGDKIEMKIRENLSKSQGVVGKQLSEFVYEFEFQGSSGVVDLSSRACTCYEWQMTGIPCQHACGVLQGGNLDVYSYVEKWYYKETQEAIYAGLMGALPVDDVASLNEVADSQCGAPFGLPFPNIKRSPGRPRVRPIDSHATAKKSLRCSLCYESGHNRRACKKRKES